MKLIDIFLVPVYLVLIYIIALIVKNGIRNKNIQKYFIPALTAKIFGSLLIGLIYQFYYSGGDTYNYYNQATIIYNAFFDNPGIGLKLLFANGQIDSDTMVYTSRMYWYFAKPEYFVVKITALFGILSFNSYSVIAIFFAVFSFSGVWALYVTFTKLYPQKTKELAYAVLFIPSVVLWGSGLLKDSLCIGALGWIFYAFYHGFVLRQSIIKSLIIFTVAFFLLTSIKKYILLAFIPAALFWLFLQYNKQIRNPLIRVVIKPLFIVLGIFIGFYAGSKITEDDARYNIERIGEQTKINSSYLYAQSVRQEGSAYTLGEMDGSLSSMIRLAPQAIFVSLYRPLIFEAKNPLMLLSALECLFFLLLTVYIVYKTGFLKIIQEINNSPFLILCLIFTLIFAFGTGINSYNFGTLSRYRIPMLPFFVTFLVVLKDIAKKKKLKAI